ncbi:aspartyl protease family protein [Thermoleptolyngbya sp. M55_K2018_002]|uniref:retroviral-like aspartic protease family protein n=1 Tax=Thermoleptolyngbya sp. M55_K2018_002 TaxID=2747808 RepID=UPI0019FCDF40|nr:aspartyl protease family protein [Thermoleptolyngbya sp. M55_K2018_002]HIK39206.1 aspartyl protease family protein [Thermoleptolyngbya sp. M55_K2018_002]
MRQLVIPQLKRKVLTTLTVTNLADLMRADEGSLPTESVRQVTLTDVLVDTGATLLCLPERVTRQLGLKRFREVEVATAAGIKPARIFQGVHLEILGREGTFDCLELPGRQDALLGVIPLEALGLEPDLQNQQLRVLPITPEQTYLSAV